MKNFTILFALTCLVFSNAFAQIPCEDGFAGEYPCGSISLLSLVTPSDVGEAEGQGTIFNDIWGWEDSESGRKIALLGSHFGTKFVEVTDPFNPVFIGNLPTHTSSSLWRDIKVFDGHAFIVAEAGGHGMQVIDLQMMLDLDPADLPITFDAGAHYDSFGNCHNICINEDSGYAYCIGTSTYSGGLHIVDINDPLNPVLAGSFAQDGYTHDSQAVMYNGPDEEYIGREIVFACNEDNVAIIDVTDKSDCQLVSHANYDTDEYTHQGWLSEDQRYFFCNDELDELNGAVDVTTTHVFDVTDLNNPIHLGFYEGDSPNVDHNLYVNGKLCYMSNYQGGLRVLDVSNPNPSSIGEVAYFDVYPNNNNAGFNGTWSNYPYFGSDLIVVTEQERGMFILGLDELLLVDVVNAGFVCEGEEVMSFTFSGFYAGEGDVSLSFVDYPDEVSPSMFSYEDEGSISVTGNILGLDNLSPGNYSITIQVLAGGSVKNIDVDFEVVEEVAFDAPNVILPAAGTIVDEGHVDFQISNQLGMTSWTAEISTTADFTENVYSIDESDVLGTYLSFPYWEGQEWFYRVKMYSDCSESVYSEGTFQTEELVDSVSEKDASQWDVYPNPAKEFIQFSNLNDGVHQAEILNIQGDVVLSETLNSNGDIITISLPSVSSGIYFVRLTSDEKTLTKKLIIE